MSEYTCDAIKRKGKQIAAIRKELGITQEDLAGKSGLDVTYISAIERGIKNPTSNTIMRIAEALNVRPLNFYTTIEAAGTFYEREKK